MDRGGRWNRPPLFLPISEVACSTLRAAVSADRQGVAYSVLSATIGSVRAARREGAIDARMVATATTTATSA